jgi:ribonucleoside-triphosphate reductase (formate)
VDVRQVAQSFVFETNQMFGNYLGPVMDTYITCTPYVPEELWDVDAVGPGGKIVGKYKDFEPECRHFFKALVEVYSEGDADGKPIRIPKHQIKINQRGMSEFEADYLYVLEKETLIQGTTYFINNITRSNLAEICGQTFSIKLKADPQFLTYQTVDPAKYNYHMSLNNFSLLQNVNINLPRLAYLAKRSSNSIFDQLTEILPEIEQVLQKKYTMIKKEIEADISKLPFCKGILPATHLKSQALLDLTKQCVSISITGLHECIQATLGISLKDEKGFELGQQIIQHIQKFAKDATQRNGFSFIVVDKGVEKSDRRFAMLDIKYEPEYAYEFVQEVMNGTKTFAYTPNIMIPYEKDATQTAKNLEIQGKLQALLGAVNFIPISKELRGKDLKANWEYLKNLLQKTSIHSILLE